ncbi:MAG: DUF2723 domain-containing protein [Proteobacteria bacterium]|nr:DUF2723 domain-containing protein [Pseudomonadota bacterium]
MPPPAAATNAPVSGVSRHWRRELPFLFAVFLSALALYAFTTPSAVGLEDDAIFISTLHFFGLPHPPGYPLYSLLGGVFYHLMPFGTPAFKAHLFSGVAAAAACCIVYIITAMLVRDRITPLFAAAALAVSKVFWSQAIIAEVYTLNALLFFALLACAISYVNSGGNGSNGNKKIVLLAAVVCGLGLANHYPLFILAGSGIAAYLLFAPLQQKIRTFLLGILIASAIAALFYSWMVWRSYDTMPAHFFGIPLDSWELIQHYISRANYASVDNEAGVTWYDKLLTLQFLANEMRQQYTVVGLLLALLGWLGLFYSPQRRLLAIALGISFFMTSVFLIFIRDFKPDYLGLAIFRVYHLTSYGILAILLALGSGYLARWCAQKTGKARGLFLSVIAVGLVTSTMTLHWEDNNRRDYRWAEDLALAKLNSVEANAIVFTNADLDLPIGYLHFVLGVRPDITLYNFKGLLYGGGLYNSFVPLEPTSDGGISKRAIIQQLIARSFRPIFYPPHLKDYFSNEKYGSDLLGFYRRVRQRPGDHISLSEQVLQWLQRHGEQEYNTYDAWTRSQHTAVVETLIIGALTAQWSGTTLSPQWQQIVEKIKQTNPRVRDLMILHALETAQLSPQQSAAAIQQCQIDTATAHELDSFTLSNHYLLCAKLVQHTHGAAHPDNERYLQLALSQFQGNENPALPYALNFYVEQEQYCRAQTLAETFYGDIDNVPPALQNSITTAVSACENSATAPAQ